MRLITLISIGFLLMTSCSELFVKPSGNEEIKFRQFNAIWEIAEQEYAFFELKNIDWDEIYNEYETRIEESRGDEYIQVIHEMLGELKDGHVAYITKSGWLRTYIPPRETKDFHAYSPELVRSYMDGQLTLVGDERMSYGTIDQSIGYIRVRTWEAGDRAWIEDIDMVLSALHSTQGLIIDVRHNEGGEARVRDRFVQRFLDSTYQAPGSYRYGEFIEGVILEPDVRIPYKKDIVVLINGVSFSATELFARDMKTIDRVTVVGDTTAGAGAAVQRFDLPDETSVRLTNWNFLRADLQPIEWNGVEPDVLVPQTADDVKSGVDKQLEYAIDFLKSN